MLRPLFLSRRERFFEGRPRPRPWSDDRTYTYRFATTERANGKVAESSRGAWALARTTVDELDRSPPSWSTKIDDRQPERCSLRFEIGLR